MSAVIYAAIVVMWAVVLVPMWLRRHDAASESRSVDRFSTAMRTLSRRAPATPGRRYVVMPKRSEAGPTVHVSGAAAPKPRQVTASRAVAPPPAPSAARPAAPSPAPRPAQRRRPSIVARRRRLLLGLLVVTLVTFVLAALGMLSWPLQLVVDVVLVAFCLHLRAQARRSAELARSRRAATAPAVRRAPSVPAASPAAAAAQAPATQAVPAVPAAPAVAEPVPAVTEPLPATGTDAVTEPAAETWEPVPVPRPTYTMMPPAPAFEADPTYSPPVYAPAAQAEVFDGDETETDLDEILERRWAVND